MAYTYSLEKDQPNYIVDPLKFALWLFILTVIMVFGGLTSAFIVQRGMVPADQQLIFDLPAILWPNLMLILFSSVTLMVGVRSLQGDRPWLPMLAFGMTFVLGLLFLRGQWQAFLELANSGLPLVDRSRADNAVSHFYVMTGLHGIHIVAALLVLLVGMWRLGRALVLGRPYQQYRFVLTAIFWHFLGVLWVYLFVFMIAQLSEEGAGAMFQRAFGF
ncbi:MAG: heme-copper oxidase subunit III [Bacteroidetes bacterium]|nr:MAG: heme-copper oxidase subunit III [Bacteroidota bacterium]